MVVYARYPLGETRVQREAEALVDAGWQVDVLCLRGEGESAREHVRGVEVHRLPMGHDKRSLGRQFASYLRFLWLAGRHLARLHRRHAIDCVQVHNLPDFLVFAALGPKLRGAPVIIDLHDLMPEFFSGRFGSGGRSWLSTLIRWQERAACAFADHVVTVSAHWRDALIERGVPARKVSVVMNLADERVFTPLPRERDDDAFELIYHGTLTRRYGLDLAIEAVAALRDDLPDLRLTIIGRGDDLTALEAMRDRLGVTDVVDIRSTLVPADQLPPVIARAHVGVVPYRDDAFTDGLLPTKLMEYAVMGLPCIAGRTTAITATFADMAELFTPGDAADLARCIRLLHDDPARREELIEGAATFTAEHGWAAEGAAYVALVERLAAGSRAARR
jgi:glycosyltransferase involved in cell wall biosynthesis